MTFAILANGIQLPPRSELLKRHYGARHQLLKDQDTVTQKFVSVSNSGLHSIK
jgi:hypothetical protein